MNNLQLFPANRTYRHLQEFSAEHVTGCDRADRHYQPQAFDGSKTLLPRQIYSTVRTNVGDSEAATTNPPWVTSARTPRCFSTVCVARIRMFVARYEAAFAQQRQRWWSRTTTNNDAGKYLPTSSVGPATGWNGLRAGFSTGTSYQLSFTNFCAPAKLDEALDILFYASCAVSYRFSSNRR